jgi:protein-disulfide isomerase
LRLHKASAKLCGVGVFACAVSLFAQTIAPSAPGRPAAPPAPQAPANPSNPSTTGATALDKPALEAYLRHLLMWTPGIAVKIGDPTPGPLPGFYAVKVRGSLGDHSQDYTFYVSADGQKIIRGDVLDVKANPFQADLDLLKTDDQPFLGIPGAPVTIVEFSDFQCPYCKQESAIMRTQLPQAYPTDIQIVHLDFPLEAMHPFARSAAILGRCIYRQNNSSFWAWHDWAFAHQGELTPANLRDKALEYAKGDKNLDITALTSCTTSPEARAEVDRTLAIGNALNITATPTMFINGRRLVGALALDELKLVIDHEIEYSKTRKKAADCCSIQLSLPGMGQPAKAPPK